MTPLLVLLFGIHPVVAVGTDLLYAAATKAGGTLTHGLRGSVDWRITGWLAIGSVPATVLTLSFLYYWGGSHGLHGSNLIQRLLGFALLLTALTLIFRSQIMAFAAHYTFAPSQHRAALLTAVTGALLGVLVSLTSVGAGAIGITALLLLYPKLPISRVIGSDIAHAVPLTLIAGVGHWLLGSVDGFLLLLLLIGSLPGVILGSYCVKRASDRLLRPLLAMVLVLAAWRLVVG
jgi:uncharacterized membrane protein YfcA